MFELVQDVEMSEDKETILKLTLNVGIVSLENILLTEDTKSLARDKFSGDIEATIKYLLEEESFILDVIRVEIDKRI